MTHPILRGAAWVLSAERAPGAPDAVYGAACMVCEATSTWAENDPKPVGMWALGHTQAHPIHRQFLVTTQRHWRADPVSGARPPSAPVPDTAGRAAPAPRRPRRPRRAGPLRAAWRDVVAYVGRFAGPLVVLSLIVGGGLLGFLLGATSDTGVARP